MHSKPFIEQRVDRGQGKVYARDYDGPGPAFVLMHGFPDNLRIYDDLIPYLTAAGRRVVAFDFLGFGASDKPAGATYRFKQQLGDLEATVQALGLGVAVVMARMIHQNAAVNFAVEHPHSRTFAFSTPPMTTRPSIWPEMIVLFADPGSRRLRALSQEAASNWAGCSLAEEIETRFGRPASFRRFRVIADLFDTSELRPCKVQLLPEFLKS
jgi:pimeloyl-ACP methyl ester carboxylesterase